MEEIKNIINKVIDSISSKKQIERQKVEHILFNILDTKEAKHARVSGLKDGKLFIDTDSSAWLYQFNLKRAKLLESIQQEAPEINSIYFRIGKMT